MWSNRGFTIVELLVAMLIFVILTAIAIPGYNRWSQKHKIESDVREIFLLLQEYQARAFTEKKDLTTDFSGDSFRIKDSSGNVLQTVDVSGSFTFKGSAVSIDKRGTFSGSSIIPTVHTEAPYDCVSVDDTRVTLGKWDGTNCNVH